MSSEILPYWADDERPHYYELSDAKYARVDVKSQLNKRGIYSPILTSLTKHLPEGAYLAGGFIMSLIKGPDLKPSDIDIFFGNESSFAQTYELFRNPPQDDGHAFTGYKTNISLDELQKNSSKIRLVKFTNEDPSKLPVQLIKMVWYNNAEAVIDSFDFTTCQFAIDKQDLVFNPISIIDLFKSRLVLHRMQYPAETLYRVIKYTKKGYVASPNSILEIVEAIRACKQIDPPGSMSMY